MKKYTKKDGTIVIGVHKALEREGNKLIHKIEEIPDEMGTNKKSKPHNQKK